MPLLYSELSLRTFTLLAKETIISKNNLSLTYQMSEKGAFIEDFGEIELNNHFFRSFNVINLTLSLLNPQL